jgi:hypothetical protein
MGCFSSKDKEPEKSIHTLKISDIVINVSNSGSNVQLDIVARRNSIENRSLDGRFTNNPVIDDILEYQTYGSLKKLSKLCPSPRPSNLGNNSLYTEGAQLYKIG